MILPIYAYGHPVLKKVGENIDENFEGLSDLIANMWETMYQAKGVGLAAPQIGLAIKLFIVDTSQIGTEEDDKEGIKKVFINAEIIKEFGDEWSYEEGCLSIPDITADLERNEFVRIKYLDQDMVEHEEEFDGYDARVIQHEFDHTMGILFVDRIKPLKRRLISRKLENIRKGKVDSKYAMKFKV